MKSFNCIYQTQLQYDSVAIVDILIYDLKAYKAGTYKFK
jgi:hypothetical protein